METLQTITVIPKPVGHQPDNLDGFWWIFPEFPYLSPSSTGPWPCYHHRDGAAPSHPQALAAATKRMASVSLPVLPTEFHRSFSALSPAHLTEEPGSFPWTITMLFMGKSTIDDEFSIATNLWWNWWVKSTFSGWWFEPPWKILVNWDDDIPNIWENKSHVPNHQRGMVFSRDWCELDMFSHISLLQICH